MANGSGRPLSSLLEGAREFGRREYAGADSLMARLASGQSPQVMVIACSDSRADPALVCGARPGDVFAVRNVANLVPPADSGAAGLGVWAAVEYAVKALEIVDLVIMGHARCGGIAAALEAVRGGGAGGFEAVDPWLETAHGACREALSELGEAAHGDTLAALAERRSVLRSLDNLRARPWIAERVAAGGLLLHGWWLDLNTGALWTTGPDGEFRPPEEAR